MAEQVSREKGSKDNKEPTEVKTDELDTSNLPDQENIKENIHDCPVCLQECTLPVKLKCGHIFCFLCIKGVAFRSRRCALCRQDVDLKYFDNPEIVHFETMTSEDEGHKETPEDADKYQWYYEGRNGWWQYEELSSAELENAHRDGKRSCELLIAGFLYFVDFENMVQFRKSEPGRRRRIKRDVVDAEKKGVAGLRFGNQRLDVAQGATNRTTSTDQVDSSNASPVDLRAIERLVIGSTNDNDGRHSDGHYGHSNGRHIDSNGGRVSANDRHGNRNGYHAVNDSRLGDSDGQYGDS